MNEKKRGSFTGSFGFIMAAAASAVGLGNIWRFPYLAAKDGGGLFLVVYLILVLTFGFTLLTSEVALGRKTQQGPLTAYGTLKKGGGFIGVIACLIPAIILPYYCAIGGWVLKYLILFISGNAEAAAEDGCFTGYITSSPGPIIAMLIFFAATALFVFLGVDKGIEKISKILMPILIVIVLGIGFFSLTLSHTDTDGTVRTGMQGLAVYVIPNFEGITLGKFLIVVLDAMGQLFFSISVCMGIMVAYGSYSKKDTNLMGSVNKIEFFDTLVAVLAGLMIIPAVFVFSGTEGMSAGPGLMFVSLPKVFTAMGAAGPIIGLLFFIMTTFAALTSAISIMEAVVASLMDAFHFSRVKSSIIVSVYAVIVGLIVCLGYTNLYFELPLPNGSIGQVLDILDYASNSILMPILGFLTCVFIGWVVGPKEITDEVELNGAKFRRKGMYIVMVKFVAPILLFVLLLSAFGIIK